MKIGTQIVNANVSVPKFKFDINTLAKNSTRNLKLNEIGTCIINTEKPIPFEPFEMNREMGGFILINRLTNATIAIGLIEQSAKTTSLELRTQESSIDQNLRARQKNQKPVTLWFTGLKRSGKTFIANALEQKLYAGNHHSIILDSESIWKGLSEDLDYLGADRLENIRRVAHVCKLMNEAGLIVMTSFTTAYMMERRLCQKIITDSKFFEIYVNTPLEISEAQDTQGFYKRARKGEIRNVAGIDIPFEPPEHPDIVVGAQTHSHEEAAEQIYQALKQKGFLSE
jgi:bifunctional enzyme CysN/CysC